MENFPFPTAPPQASLERALDLLVNLGAITPPQRVQSLDVAAMAIGKTLREEKTRRNERRGEKMMVKMRVVRG